MRGRGYHEAAATRALVLPGCKAAWAVDLARRIAVTGGWLAATAPPPGTGQMRLPTEPAAIPGRT